MNKTLYVISLIVVLTLTSCQSSQMTNQTAPRELQPDIHAEVKASQLPADIAVPETFPTTIQDPILLEAWIILSNRKQTCHLWDGYTLSGQQLAQYVVDQAVVIAWNTNPAYRGSWVDRVNTKILYINPDLKEETETQMTQLVSTLSHEIFHYSTPFNQKADTLYEEYWAFYLGACVSGQSTESFYPTNPMSSASLTRWFKTNGRSNYLGEYEMYPENIVAMSLP